MTQTQIKIRIRLDQSTTPSEPSEPEQSDESVLSTSSDYDYDWRKISIAILLLLSILATVFWVASTWLIDHDKHEASSADISSSWPETSADPEPEHSTHTQTTIPIETPSIQSVENDPGNDEHTVTDINSDKSTEVSIPIPPSPPPPVESDSVIKPETKPEAPTIHHIAAETEPDVPIQSHANVIRAQLTSGIRQREPIDHIDQISLARKPSRPIYFFLHLYGRKDEKVMVDWFYRDRHAAQVILEIGADDWRTYASKVLEKNKLGTWRVTASDQSGNLIAEFKFRVTR